MFWPGTRSSAWRGQTAANTAWCTAWYANTPTTAQGVMVQHGVASSLVMLLLGSSSPSETRMDMPDCAGSSAASHRTHRAKQRGIRVGSCGNRRNRARLCAAQPHKNSGHAGYLRPFPTLPPPKTAAPGRPRVAGSRTYLWFSNRQCAADGDERRENSIGRKPDDAGTAQAPRFRDALTRQPLLWRAPRHGRLHCRQGGKDDGNSGITCRHFAVMRTPSQCSSLGS